MYPVATVNKWLTLGISFNMDMLKQTHCIHSGLRQVCLGSMLGLKLIVATNSPARIKQTRSLWTGCDSHWMDTGVNIRADFFKFKFLSWWRWSSFAKTALAKASAVTYSPGETWILTFENYVWPLFFQITTDKMLGQSHQVVTFCSLKCAETYPSGRFRHCKDWIQRVSLWICRDFSHRGLKCPTMIYHFFKWPNSAKKTAVIRGYLYFSFYLPLS